MEKKVIEFEQVIPRGCGMDVHKKTVTATINGEGIKQETKTFSTFTGSLKELQQWLKANGITHVAMESTGVYWKPVFNILEEDFEVILVNARYVKNVPGKKTDGRDSRWITKLLLSGLLQGSFIPPREIRELRDLFRYKRKLVQQVTSEKNRFERILEDANIKLSSVVSDLFGASSEKMLNAMLEGEDNVEVLVDMCHGRLNVKREAIKEALIGDLTEHHKFMLRIIKENILKIEGTINKINEQIQQQVKVYKKEIELLQTIPGVGEDTAIGIIAEIGVNMDVFPNEQHLSSWAGMSPGNNESAGKKKSERTTHGDKTLKSVLIESAWAASHTKNTFLRSKYDSLVGRRGKKRALVAVGHKILVAAYFIIRDKVPYQEPQMEIDERKRKRRINNYVAKLKELGLDVKLKEVA